MPPELLCKECAGDLDFVYEHSTYWPALLKLCEDRRAANLERWVKAGRNFGESEVYLKGGDAPSNFAGVVEINEVKKVDEVKEVAPATDPAPADEEKA